eukprot:IDg16365t1
MTGSSLVLASEVLDSLPAPHGEVLRANAISKNINRLRGALCNHIRGTQTGASNKKAVDSNCNFTARRWIFWRVATGKLELNKNRGSEKNGRTAG